jgi:predicted nuclease with TOPRIM domain
MGKPTADEVSKEVGTNLDAWYKRNASRIKLIDNLTLDCELCKTKEAKELLKKEIDLSFKTLKGEVDKLNKQNESLFKDVEKPPPKDLSKQIQETIDKKITVYNKDGVKVKLNGKLDKGVPFVGVEGSF